MIAVVTVNKAVTKSGRICMVQFLLVTVLALTRLNTLLISTFPRLHKEFRVQSSQPVHGVSPNAIIHETPNYLQTTWHLSKDDNIMLSSFDKCQVVS